MVSAGSARARSTVSANRIQLCDCAESWWSRCDVCSLQVKEEAAAKAKAEAARLEEEKKKAADEAAKMQRKQEKIKADMENKKQDAEQVRLRSGSSCPVAPAPTRTAPTVPERRTGVFLRGACALLRQSTQ